MIIVEKWPFIVDATACPLIPVTVKGQAGKQLRVRSFDMFTGELVGDATYDIDSDDWRSETVVIPLPTHKSLVYVRFDVVDPSTNSVVEMATRYVLHLNGQADEYVPIQPNDIIYIVIKSGTVLKIEIGSDGQMPWPLAENGVPLDSDAWYYAIIYRKGRIIMYEGLNKVCDVQGRAVILTLQFKVSRQLAVHFSNFLPNYLSSALTKAPELAEILGGVAVLKALYEDRRFIPHAVAVSFDDQYVYLDISGEFDLYSPVDIAGFIKMLAGIGAIAVGGFLLYGSFGVGAPASIAFIAGGISCILSGCYTLDLLKYNTEAYKEKARRISEGAKAKMQQTRTDLEDYLNQLVSQGKITEEDKNTILSYVDSIIEEASKAMTELQDVIDQAYREGYNKAKSEMMTWVLGAGVAGFIAGFLLSTRTIVRGGR